MSYSQSWCHKYPNSLSSSVKKRGLGSLILSDIRKAKDSVTKTQGLRSRAQSAPPLSKSHSLSVCWLGPCSHASLRGGDMATDSSEVTCWQPLAKKRKWLSISQLQFSIPRVRMRIVLNPLSCQVLHLKNPKKTAFCLNMWHLSITSIKPLNFERCGSIANISDLSLNNTVYYTAWGWKE